MCPGSLCSQIEQGNHFYEFLSKKTKILFQVLLLNLRKIVLQSTYKLGLHEIAQARYCHWPWKLCLNYKSELPHRCAKKYKWRMHDMHDRKMQV